MGGVGFTTSDQEIVSRREKRGDGFGALDVLTSSDHDPSRAVVLLPSARFGRSTVRIGDTPMGRA